MTKTELITNIADLLRDTGKEVVVKDFSILRNGRWGLHAYCLKYQHGMVTVLPFSGSIASWLADLRKLTVTQLQTIRERILNA